MPLENLIPGRASIWLRCSALIASVHTRRPSGEAEQQEAPLRVRVHPHALRVQVGAPVDVVVAVDYEVCPVLQTSLGAHCLMRLAKFFQEAADGAALDVAVTFDLVDNYGNIIRVCINFCNML